MKRLMIAISIAGTLAITTNSSTSVAHAGAPAARPAANLAAATPSDIIATAKAHLGDRYATIGNSPATGFSCIGFVNYVFAQHGVQVPFDIPQAWGSAPHVSMNELLPGDVLFFSNTVFAGLSHVAIYIGAGEMIGADNFSVGVTTDRLRDSYWSEHYTGATRPLAGLGTSPAPGTEQPTAAATASPRSDNGSHATTSTPTPMANSGSAGQAATSTPRAMPAPQSGATAPSGTLLRPLAAVVGLYSGPGYQYIPVANVGPGNVLTVLLGQGSWYSVRQGAIYGWVSASQVAPIEGSSTQATPTATRITPEATPRQAFSKAALTTGASNTADLYVVQGPLWVRSGPGKSFQEVASLGAGTPIRVHATHPHWALVTAPGNITGWVARQYLGQMPPVQDSRAATTRGSATQVATLAFARVTTAMLNVRTQPEMQAPTIAVLFAGETVQILARRTGWDQVMLRHHAVGWANAAWLADQSNDDDHSTHGT